MKKCQEIKELYNGKDYENLVSKYTFRVSLVHTVDTIDELIKSAQEYVIDSEVDKEYSDMYVIESIFTSEFNYFNLIASHEIETIFGNKKEEPIMVTTNFIYVTDKIWENISSLKASEKKDIHIMIRRTCSTGSNEDLIEYIELVYENKNDHQYSTDF